MTVDTVQKKKFAPKNLMSCNYHQVLKYILTFVVVRLKVNCLVSPCFLIARSEIVQWYKGGFDDDDDDDDDRE